jgi:hypothetical protein
MLKHSHHPYYIPGNTTINLTHPDAFTSPEIKMFIFTNDKWQRVENFHKKITQDYYNGLSTNTYNKYYGFNLIILKEDSDVLYQGLPVTSYAFDGLMTDVTEPYGQQGYERSEAYRHLVIKKFVDEQTFWFIANACMSGRNPHVRIDWNGENVKIIDQSDLDESSKIFDYDVDFPSIALVDVELKYKVEKEDNEEKEEKRDGLKSKLISIFR